MVCKLVLQFNHRATALMNSDKTPAFKFKDLIYLVDEYALRMEARQVDVEQWRILFLLATRFVNEI